MADLMNAKTVQSASWLLGRRREALRLLVAAKTLHKQQEHLHVPNHPNLPRMELDLESVMRALAEVQHAIIDPALIQILDAAYAPLIAGMDEQLRAMGVEPPAPGDEDERHNRSLTE